MRPELPRLPWFRASLGLLTPQRAPVVRTLRVGRRTRTPAGPCEPYLAHAWKLWEEIVPLGYEGRYQRVRACLRDVVQDLS